MEEQYYNVAFSLKEWLDNTDLNNSNLTALSFDFFDATALISMFNAYATAVTGVYEHKPFMTKTTALKDLRSAINFVAELPDDCPKLLYGLQRIEDSDLFRVEQDVPAQFILRYAVVEG
jgi:hypothetical protein